MVVELFNTRDRRHLSLRRLIPPLPERPWRRNSFSSWWLMTIPLSVVEDKDDDDDDDDATGTGADAFSFCASTNFVFSSCSSASACCNAFCSSIDSWSMRSKSTIFFYQRFAFVHEFRSFLNQTSQSSLEIRRSSLWLFFNDSCKLSTFNFSVPISSFNDAFSSTSADNSFSSITASESLSLVVGYFHAHFFDLIL